MSGSISRRSFLRCVAGSTAAALPGASLAAARPADGADRPNVILAMTDDQGWGDVAYNGNKHVKTPNLDKMAAEGIRFDRFYSGAPVCSPTRGSAITGRHPYRYGIPFANTGHMRKAEITIAEALKPLGYATGHFGKWHLGTLTRTVKESNRGGPGGTAHYAPPWDNGFDVCFSTEAKVPTWDPMKDPKNPARPYGTHYWDEKGRIVRDNLDGDDSRVIMDRALPFIRAAAKAGKPFLAVIWFHSPHLPVVNCTKHKKMYPNLPAHAQAYFGCISGVDEQVGRLRAELADLGVAGNTMLWYCADNGPEGRKHSLSRAAGSAGPFRGRKRDLWEGGVRVPGLLAWPEKVTRPRVVKMPCSTLDYFPTVMDVLGYQPKGKVEPIDGVSLLPLIEGKMTERPAPIGFESRNQISLNDNRYKLITPNGGKTWMLFDIVADPSEKRNLAADKPDVVKRMRAELDKWRASCKASLAGKDYPPGTFAGPTGGGRGKRKRDKGGKKDGKEKKG